MIGTYGASSLCKRTISVTVRGLTHHLVAYFDARDLMSNALCRPSMDPYLAGIDPRPELLNQNFLAPVERDDEAEMLYLMRP